MRKMKFNLQDSLKRCPPEYIYGIGPNGEKWYGEPGVQFLKRHVMNLDNVRFDVNDQNKVEENIKENISEIGESFLAKNWDHGEPPLQYEDSRDGNKGTTGFHRYEAAKIPPWDCLPFDKVVYRTPLFREIAKHNSNNGNPKKINRIKDTVNSVKRCVEQNTITADKVKDPDQTAIKDLIIKLTPGKDTKHRNLILKKYRACDSGHVTLKTWDSDSANAFCKINKLPFKGSVNEQESGKCGYVKPQGTFKPLLHDCMSLIVNEKVPKVDGAYIPIEIRGFIEDPSPASDVLKRQRIAWLKSFKKHVLLFAKDFYEKTTGQEYVFDLPIVFKGFLHQDISPIETKDGLPKEQSVILEDWMLEEVNIK